MLKLELPSRGTIPARVWVSTLVGLLLAAFSIGYWDGNGTTTWNSVAHLADTAGECAHAVTVLKTQQIDIDSLHHDSHTHPTSQSK